MLLVLGALVGSLSVMGVARGGVATTPAAAPSTAQSVPAASAATLCSAPRGKTVRVTLDVAGQGRRTALMHLPRSFPGHPVPMLLALHGASGSGAFMESYSGLSRLADREGFAVAYPDAAGPRWRISAGDGSADVAFLDALLDRLMAGGCVDENRISAVGVSNGAGMAVRYACDAEDRLAGLVSVAGGYSSLPPCRANGPLSVLEIHGTADAVVPYYGRPGQPQGDVVRFVTSWVQRGGCTRAAQRRQASARVLWLTWAPCRNGATVQHLRLIGGTHAWPGTDGPDFGVSASEEAWKFLRGRRRSAAGPQDQEG